MMMQDLQIGDEVRSIETKAISTVTSKTETSIELFNWAITKKGRDSTNWYEKNAFERMFEKVEGDRIERRLSALKEWLNECIEKQKWGDFDRYYFTKDVSKKLIEKIMKHKSIDE